MHCLLHIPIIAHQIVSQKDMMILLTLWLMWLYSEPCNFFEKDAGENHKRIFWIDAQFTHRGVCPLESNECIITGDALRIVLMQNLLMRCQDFYAATSCDNASRCFTGDFSNAGPVKGGFNGAPTICEFVTREG